MLNKGLPKTERRGPSNKVVYSEEKKNHSIDIKEIEKVHT